MVNEMDSKPGATEALGAIVAEIVNQFDEAREANHDRISSMVGCRFEAKARAALAMIDVLDLP